MRITAAIGALIISMAACSSPPDIVTPLTTFVITDAGDAVITSGTWTIPDASTAGDRIADPINGVKIWCGKSTQRCFEAVATLLHGADRDKAKYLDADLVEYGVTSWSSKEITAETEALCVTTVLTINIATNEVFKISRNGGASADGCKNMTSWHPLKKPVVAKLVDGVEAMKADPRTH
jgi:hypothetical protein